MVASAPSPTAEWPLVPSVALPDASAVGLPPAEPSHEGMALPAGTLSPPTRWLTTHLALPAADVLAGLACAALVARLPLAPDAALLTVMWVIALAVHGTFGPAAIRTLQVRPVARAGVLLAFLSVVVGSVDRSPAGPVAVVAFLAVAAPVAVLGRLTARAVTAPGPTRVVLAGHRRGVERMLRELGTTDSPFRVVGVCLTAPASAEGIDVPVTTGLADLRTWAARLGTDAVVAVPGPQLDPAGLRRLGWGLEGTPLELMVATGVHDLGATRSRLDHDGSISLIRLRHARLDGGTRRAKAAWERTAALLALTALAPVLLTLAAVVRLESRGPALFRQTRIGRDGRPFTMLKLRTMCADAEQRRPDLVAASLDGHVLFKLPEDPRITRVGRFLRRYSLDELPQLVNVVRGDMALVGPRPALADEVARYTTEARRRLAVTPGLTGLWQVSGRSDLSWEESVRLDVRYVENWSIALDAQILVRTVRAVLSHHGAY